MSRTGLFIAALWMMVALSGCGRSVTIKVQYAQTHEPVAGAMVLHERMEWRLMGIVPYKFPILKDSAASDPSGVVNFEGVRKSDLLKVVRHGNTDVEPVWFGPLWPLEKTYCLPEIQLLDTYRDLNETANWDDATLRLVIPVNHKTPYP